MAKNEVIISSDVDVRNMIYEIRGQRVMLDSDLANLYGYTVKAFNQQVQRNIERFPSDFMFKLTFNEEIDLKSQNVTSSYTQLLYGGKRKPSNVFTEQGIYALSGVLKGPLATAVSIKLIRAFKELKDFYIQNNYLLDRVIGYENKLLEYQSNTNNKLIEHDDKFNQIFDYISTHKEATEKVFYKGQIYDSFVLFSDLISKANKEITLIDNYVDNKTLNILAKKNANIDVLIYTSLKGNKLTNSDINAFNSQYPAVSVSITNKFHDRFLIIDNKTIYLIGASLKDAGNKCFGVVEIDSSNITRILNEI